MGVDAVRRKSRQPAQRVEHSQDRQFYNRAITPTSYKPFSRWNGRGQRTNRLTSVVEMLTAALSPAMTDRAVEGTEFTQRAAIIEAVEARGLNRHAELPGTGNDPPINMVNSKPNLVHEL